MSRIDDIKDRRDESDSFREWFTDGWERNKGAIDDLINHNKQLSESVHYLLSRLEIAEEALTEMFDNVKRISNAGGIKIDSDGHATALINPAAIVTELGYTQHRLEIVLQQIRS